LEALVFRRHFKKAIALSLLALFLGVFLHGFGHSSHSMANASISEFSHADAGECSVCAFVRRIKTDDGWIQTLIHVAWIPQGKIFPIQQLLQFFVFALLLFSRAPPF